MFTTDLLTMFSSLPLAFLGLPYGAEWILIGGVALLLFGSRLPNVAKSIGQSIVSFKRGLKEAEHEITSATSDDSSKPAQPRFDPHTGKPLEPKFDPYTGKPL